MILSELLRMENQIIIILFSSGVQGVRLLLHGGIEDGLPELLESDQSDSHFIDTSPLVRLFLLSAI